ncbi:hypothetical protein QBC34DRAFT_390958 [Podospora aff. communis PSN243]|uniref:Uncharacterized protein n=1 Tax=Podospora aff. communis PSN243 TaxID=3040156 RepID=A0AAV9H2G3_9PEZI|nr:hypothetical protein QBC34DRAFT_390958 [Podospora aff. communis PSN243]
MAIMSGQNQPPARRVSSRTSVSLPVSSTGSPSYETVQKITTQYQDGTPRSTRTFFWTDTPDSGRTSNSSATAPTSHLCAPYAGRQHRRGPGRDGDILTPRPTHLRLCHVYEINPRCTDSSWFQIDRGIHLRQLRRPKDRPSHQQNQPQVQYQTPPLPVLPSSRLVIRTRARPSRSAPVPTTPTPLLPTPKDLASDITTTPPEADSLPK